MLPNWPLVRAHCVAVSIVYMLKQGKLGNVQFVVPDENFFPESPYQTQSLLSDKDKQRLTVWAATRWTGWKTRIFPYGTVFWMIEMLNSTERDLVIQILEQEYNLGK